MLLVKELMKDLETDKSRIKTWLSKLADSLLPKRVMPAAPSGVFAFGTLRALETAEEYTKKYQPVTEPPKHRDYYYGKFMDEYYKIKSPWATTTTGTFPIGYAGGATTTGTATAITEQNNAMYNHLLDSQSYFLAKEKLNVVG